MHFFMFVFTFSGTVIAKTPGPLYQWPLGDKAGLVEVLSRGPSMLNNGNQCFEFGKNSDTIPYQAILIGGTTVPHLSVVLDEPELLRDLAISMYVKPIGKPTGTLLQYKSDSAETIRIMFDPYDSLAMISFRDKYDITAGIVMTEHIATADIWTHFVVQRTYKTGRITVYADGKKVVDEDNEFQDEITLPASGVLRIGNTDPPDADGNQQFKGFVSCLQIFTDNVKEDDVKAIQKFCLPDKWSPGSQEYFGPEDKETGTRCKLEPPDSTSNIPLINQLLTMTHLLNERKWTDVRTCFNWENSKTYNAYFRKSAQNMAPVPETVTIGDVKTVNLKTCAHLCLRVNGCTSFAFTSSRNGVRRCVLFDVVPLKLESKHGVNHYTLNTRQRSLE